MSMLGWVVGDERVRDGSCKGCKGGGCQWGVVVWVVVIDGRGTDWGGGFCYKSVDRFTKLFQYHFGW